MRIEVVDRESGAILFKKDEDSKMLDKLVKKVTELESEVKDLKSRITELEGK